MKAALMTAAAMGVAVAVQANAQSAPRGYDIAAQDLGTALTQLARQSNRQLHFSADLTRGKRARRISGRMSFEQALDRLLQGTGLVHRQTASGATVIQRGETATAQESASDEVATGRSEILVIGSRSLNADIRRSEDADQPYVIFGKDEIRASQATSVEDFLRTRLPQNAGFAGTGSQSGVGVGQPYSTFNLRGLGTNQTLILVNGRRIADRSVGNGGPAQPDLNGIPVGAIERIEVLPSSAGGIYGGNAVGGVINIILRSDYRGIDLTLTHNSTFDFHAPMTRLDVAGGFALEGGRTSVSFNGAISDSGTLLLSQRRGLVQRGVDLGFANQSPYVGNGAPPIGNGVNIRSSTGANLVLDNGVALGSNVTNVPLGYAGYAADGGAALLAGAGRFNLDMPEDLNAARRGLLTASEMQSFNVSVKRKFSSWLDIFADYSHFVNKGHSFGVTQLPATATLAANAPTNPFQQAVTVTFPTPNYAFPYEFEGVSRRLSAGAIVRLSSRWAVNLEFNRSWSSSRSEGYLFVTDAFAGSCGLNASTAATCAGRPVLNPFQAPVDFGSYLFNEPTAITGPYKARFDNPVIRASGPLFGLPGGSATLTAALQREARSIEGSRDESFNQQTRERSYTFFSPRFQRTNSAYAEVTLPLVSAANGVPFIREFELRGAVRHDAYLTRSAPLSAYQLVTPDPNAPFPGYTPLEASIDSTNYTLAGRYSPIDGVVLRASYATGFLPPSVVQLASTTLSSVQFTPDPFRGNRAEGYAITLITGQGNTALEPERSKSLSLGVILTPFKGLRFSADYTRIKKDSEIGSIPPAYLLANPQLFPGRVVREAAPLPGDPAGFLGRIISIDQTPLNFFRAIYQSVDFQLDYNIESEKAGKLRLYAIGTWHPDSIRQTTAQGTSLNYAGNRDGPLRWQGNGGFDWQIGNFNVQWNTQVYGSYNVYNTADPSTTAGAAAIASAIALQGARKIPVQSYSDVFVAYDFRDGTGLLNGVKLSAGIQNLFDKTPPVLAITTYRGTGYSSYGDPRLRRFTVSLRKSFGTR
ncbi:hypothetical protein BFL28_12520 [Sphingomonas turrisvirgatae]|uniref:Secretin/TonB short N-terminal domain-containing protein n=3 Tax=Pseudomonadota TaxID=1224 RepID=A0A1E3LZ75_9SPHN|nr:hypothetical protein BFL28_12520 [Sphingomonas turrisvirgatae]